MRTFKSWMRHPTRRRLLLLLAALAPTAFVAAAPAFGQLPPGPEPREDFFLSPYFSIADAAATWKPILLAYATRLFILLATLELIWTLYEGLFRRQLGMQDALTLFAKRAFVILLLFNFLLWAPGISPNRGLAVVFDSFIQIGADAGGLTGISASAFFTRGIDLALAMGEKISAFTLLTAGLQIWTVVGAIFLVYAAYFLISLTAVFIFVEAIVVVAMGFFMLAFSGSRLTIGLSQGYLAWLFRTGIKLMVLYLLLGLGWILTNDWIVLVEGFEMFEVKGYLTIAGAALLYALAVFRLPTMAGGLIPSGEQFINLRMLFQD